MGLDGMADRLRHWQRTLGLAERRCAACHAPFLPKDAVALCAACRARLIPRARICPTCGALSPLASSEADMVCGNCLVQPPPWTRLHALGVYQGLLRALLLRAKFRGDRSLTATLGTLLAGKILATGHAAEVIVPMPLHPARLRQRGYNQCHELARPLAAMLGIPRKPDWARRVIATHPQTSLSRRDRLHNLDHAFRALPDVRDRRILILDDTMTTGTSLRRLSECLLRAGAAEIETAVVAVTPLEVRDSEQELCADSS